LAVCEIGEDVWRSSASLTRQLHALPAFVAGLQLVPAGPALARELGLDLVPPGIDIAARASTRGAIAFARLPWSASLADKRQRPQSHPERLSVGS